MMLCSSIRFILESFYLLMHLLIKEVVNLNLTFAVTLNLSISNVLTRKRNFLFDKTETYIYIYIYIYIKKDAIVRLKCD